MLLKNHYTTPSHAIKITGNKKLDSLSVTHYKKREFPDNPVVRTWCFHCWGPGFSPWSENEDPTSHTAWPNKERERKGPNKSSNTFSRHPK